jgi:hypothetical protein
MVLTFFAAIQIVAVLVYTTQLPRASYARPATERHLRQSVQPQGEAHSFGSRRSNWRLMRY